MRGRPCDGDCFHCPYPDCIRSGASIIKMESLIKDKKYRRLVGRSTREDTSWIPSAREIKVIRGTLSQTQFGRLLGVSRTTICKWETGRETPSDENAVKLVQLREAER